MKEQQNRISRKIAKDGGSVYVINGVDNLSLLTGVNVTEIVKRLIPIVNSEFEKILKETNDYQITN